MIRFFCSICKRIKRARNYPHIITFNAQETNIPADRIGECNFHHFHSRRQSSITRVDTAANHPIKSNSSTHKSKRGMK